MDNIRIELTKDELGIGLVFVNGYGDECVFSLSRESALHLASAVEEFAADANPGELKVIDFDILDSNDE